MSVSGSDLESGLKDLRLRNVPVIVHASLRSFGQVEGGPDMVAHVLASIFPIVMAPTFTYKTMIIPMVGPPENGMIYARDQDANRMAEFFTPEMPVDVLIGSVPEALRQHPLAERSNHPILSFTGIHAGKMLDTQNNADPLAPLGALESAGGWVLLLGVNQTVNTSIHYAEKLSGRLTFTRWALTPQGVVECPSFPGCSAGFEEVAPDMEAHIRRTQIGNAEVQAMPLKALFDVVTRRIKKDPLTILCQQDHCERGMQVRRLLQNSTRTVTGT